MIFVRYNKTATTITKVETVHYKPDILSEEDLATGILVDAIPTPDKISNKAAVLMIDPITKELSYSYVDIPLTLEKQIDILKSQNAQMILSLVNGGLM